MELNIGNTFIKCYNHEYCKEKVLIFAHGFPGTNRLLRLIPFLKEKGIAWAEVNYQGDRNTQGKFSLIGSIKDIHSATELIKARFNPFWIGILGYSYGGLCTLNLVKEYKNLFNRVILLNPVINTDFFKSHPIMPSLWDIAKKILNLKEEDFYKKEIEELIKRYNPIKFKEELPKGIHIIQSTNDTLCPFYESKKFAYEIGALFIPLEGKGHDLEGDELINILPL